MPATIQSVIDRVADEFDHADLYFGHGTDNALDEAAWLVGHHLGIEPSDLEDHLGDAVAPDAVARIDVTMKARIQTRQPLAYLLNEAWFAGLKFHVDPRVIVPRSLTAEFILERFEPWIDPKRVTTILDLCTGCASMAVALCRRLSRGPRRRRRYLARGAGGRAHQRRAPRAARARAADPIRSVRATRGVAVTMSSSVTHLTSTPPISTPCRRSTNMNLRWRWRPDHRACKSSGAYCRLADST